MRVAPWSFLPHRIRTLVVVAACIATSCGPKERKGPPHPGETGAACTSDSECDGPGTPQCLTGLFPFSTMTGSSVRTDGLSLLGGYCSVMPYCELDSDCGDGGVCYHPLAGVDPTVIATAGETLATDFTSFQRLGVCLDPCTEASDCRPGYVCTLPFYDTLSNIAGAD